MLLSRIIRGADLRLLCSAVQQAPATRFENFKRTMMLYFLVSRSALVVLIQSRRVQQAILFKRSSKSKSVLDSIRADLCSIHVESLPTLHHLSLPAGVSITPIQNEDQMIAGLYRQSDAHLIQIYTWLGYTLASKTNIWILNRWSIEFFKLGQADRINTFLIESLWAQINSFPYFSRWSLQVAIYDNISNQTWDLLLNYSTTSYQECKVRLTAAYLIQVLSTLV